MSFLNRIFKRSLRLSQNGFVEIMAVMAVAAAGGVVIVSGIELANRLQKSAQNERQLAGRASLQMEIERLLSVDAVCARNFGATRTGGGLTEANGVLFNEDLVDATGAAVFRVNDTPPYPYANGMFKINHWEVRNSTIPIDPTRDVVELWMEFEKTQSSIGSNKFVAKMRLIAQHTGPAATTPIQACYAIIGSGTDLWVRTASYNDIGNTNPGNIGIATSTPTERLDVNGNTQVDGKFTANSMTATSDVAAPGSTFATLGKLGLGVTSSPNQLTVNGVMRLSGDAQITQTTTTEGGLHARLNYTGVGPLTVGGTAQIQTLQNDQTLLVNGAANFTGVATFLSRLTTASQISIAIANTSAPAPIEAGAMVRGDSRVTGSVNADDVAGTRICRGGDCATTFATQDGVNRMLASFNVDGTTDFANPNCSAPNSFFQRFSGLSPVCYTVPTSTCPVGEYPSSFDPYTGGAMNCQPVRMETSTLSAGPSCSGIQLMVGVTGSTATCQNPAIPGGSCNAPDVVRGINSVGTPICGPPGRARACPTGQVAIGIDADGYARCGFASAGGNCGPNQMVRGVNADGSPQCGAMSIPGGDCPQGSVVQSISANGVASCGTPGLPVVTPPTPPPSVTCASTTQFWSASSPAASCQGSLPTTTAGSSATATSGAPNGTGSANYLCQFNGAWAPNGPSSCAPQRCPAGVLPWTVAGISCAANFPQTVGGATSGVGTDSDATTSTGTANSGGSARFQCLASGVWDTNAIGASCTASGGSGCFDTFTVFFAYNSDCSGGGDDVVFSCPSGQGAPQGQYGTSGAPQQCGSIPNPGAWTGTECRVCGTPPTCPAGTSTSGTGGAHPSDANCKCPSGQNWDTASGSCQVPPTGCGEQRYYNQRLLADNMCQDLSGAAYGHSSNDTAYCPADYYPGGPLPNCDGEPTHACFPCGPGSTPGDCKPNPACGGAPASCPAGTSTSNTGGAHPSDAACKCPSGQNWDTTSSTCQVPTAGCEWNGYASYNTTTVAVGATQTWPGIAMDSGSLTCTPPAGYRCMAQGTATTTCTSGSWYNCDTLNEGIGAFRIDGPVTVTCETAIAAPSCPTGTTTSNTGGAHPTQTTCHCPSGQTWDSGSSSCQAPSTCTDAFIPDSTCSPAQYGIEYSVPGCCSGRGICSNSGGIDGWQCNAFTPPPTCNPPNSLRGMVYADVDVCQANSSDSSCGVGYTYAGFCDGGTFQACCAPTTPTCPAGTSTSGSGGAHPTQTTCRCPSGQNWDSGSSSCQAPPTVYGCHLSGDGPGQQTIAEGASTLAPGCNQGQPCSCYGDPGLECYTPDVGMNDRNYFCRSKPCQPYGWFDTSAARQWDSCGTERVDATTCKVNAWESNNPFPTFNCSTAGQNGRPPEMDYSSP